MDLEPADSGDSALLKDLADLLDEREQREEENALVPAVKQEEEQACTSTSAMLRSLLPSNLLGGLMLEALNGFLFLLDGEGMVDFMSDTTEEFIGEEGGKESTRAGDALHC